MDNRIHASPDGTKLLAVGNFKLVNGQDRNQIAMIDLSTSPSIPLANWQTQKFAPACASRFDTYIRDVDFSPDGSYFAVVTTGIWLLRQHLL